MEFEPFKGNKRFEPRRLLGSGTAGAVYEVWDREREGLVALKILHHGDPAQLYRFKKEFRALADLSHPNLIGLHELLHIDGLWLVTMDLVPGTDFITYVRETRVVERGVAALEARLRPVARQLAQGIQALHDAGRLHRDVKPSNVLVTGDGRVVLLDFGLVTETRPLHESVTDDLLGTPVYMAPEQGKSTSDELSEATDWYAVGTLIFEALTGSTPFQGPFFQVMLDKQRREPSPPQATVADISDAWNDLCADLLRCDPEERPRGVEVLLRLGASREDDEAPIPFQSLAPPSLLGRDEDLATIWRHFERVRDGEAVNLYIHGASGFGKSTLVQQFLSEVREAYPQAVLLAGRCYEHESVPFKAFDSVVDALSRYLRALSDDEVFDLLPRDVLALARLFPVLKRVPAVTASRREALEIRDSLELRRRAFRCLRELLTRLAEDHPLVVFVDDLQWGDFDSAVLFTELLRPPDPPPFFLIGAYRDDDTAKSPFLQALELEETATSSGEPTSTERGAPPREHLMIGQLSPEATENLVRELFGGSVHAEVAPTIARESEGNPLFVHELVRHVRIRGSGAEVPPLAEVLRSRVEDLEPPARLLIELLAVAGQPIALDVARRAARFGADDLGVLTALRHGHLARASGHRAVDWVEIDHDQVRRAVLGEMSPERLRELHLLLARELETAGRSDPEVLAHHFAAAGETARAHEYAAAAADRAVEALAFNRAARLFCRALELGPGSYEMGRILKRRQAEVLSNAGRAAEAAEIYLELVEGAQAAEALEMRRRAAENWLVSGRIDKGLEALNQVLSTIGLSMPKDVRRALPGMLFRRLRRRILGSSFTERDSTQIPAEVLTRIDTCWSAAIGLGFVDTPRGAPFQALHLDLALAAGEPYRVARALALEVGYTAAAGGPNRARTLELIERTRRLVERVDEPHAHGLLAFTSGLASYLFGDWPEALEQLERAESILRDRCTGVVWELDSTGLYILRTLPLLGELRELARRLPVVLKEARERGDLYAETNFRTRIAWIVRLRDDDPEAALAELDEGIVAWSQEGFHLQHMWDLLGRTEIDLYREDAAWDGASEGPWSRLAESWPRLERSFFQRIQNTFVETHFLYGRAALRAASARGPTGSKELLAVAGRAARKIADQGMPWSDPIATLLEAGIAATHGQDEVALECLEVAERGFGAVQMKLLSAVARRQRARLLGGDEGAELLASAERFMTGQGISKPARIAATWAPGNFRDGREKA